MPPDSTRTEPKYMQSAYRVTNLPEDERGFVKTTMSLKLILFVMQHSCDSAWQKNIRIQ